MNNNSFDVLIAGCGFAGAACARLLAERGRHVLILEKRPHIGGNMYDFKDSNGVLIHRFGPHIFHTSDKEIFEFLKRFSSFFPYEHRVLGRIDGQLVPIPFNFTSIDRLFEKDAAQRMKQALQAAFPGREKVTVSELLSCGGEALKAGEYIYEKVFLHYTAKQWGTPAENVDRSVLARVPAVLGTDDRYFGDTYQYMPTEGYTRLFENMLDHPNISVELNCDAKRRLAFNTESGTVAFDGQPFTGKVIWTGPVDELFDCVYGRLPYRSLDLVFEQHPVTAYQPAAVVNYPNEEEFTRITEFKYLTGQKIEGATTIMKEFPLDYKPGGGSDPYYPIINEQNSSLYQQYEKLSKRFESLRLCGRLAEYRYYNMDAAVAVAIKLAESL